MSRFASSFTFKRRVAFADTDAMGVVHHMNYLRYFEEARVAWLRELRLDHEHYPKAPLCLAVLETVCRHRAPARFEDELLVHMQVRRERLKIVIQYAIVRADQPDDAIALGQTKLVGVDKELRPVRMPDAFAAQLEKEKWTETWL